MKLYRQRKPALPFRSWNDFSSNNSDVWEYFGSIDSPMVNRKEGVFSHPRPQAPSQLQGCLANHNMNTSSLVEGIYISIYFLSSAETTFSVLQTNNKWYIF